jgi:4-amino-4-deoxy-L-arabinose transferase-like glycosyltransferase
MRARHVHLLAGITILGALLRWVTLGDQSYWGDEGVTVSLVRSSFGDMLDVIPKSESTPPLYYVLAWGWTRLVGSSGEWGLRSLSALAGTLTIPVAYAAAATLVTRRAGLATAALAACSPLLVWYSQESRAYALLMLMTAVTLWLFARAIEREARPRALALWALAAAVALATHYFAAFAVVPQAVWLIWRSPAGRRAALTACAAVALAGAALLPLALEQRSTGNTAYIADIAFGQRAKEVPKKFLVGEQATPGDYGALIERLKWVAGLLALLGVALLLSRADARERAGAAIAASLALGGLALPLALKLAGLDYLAAYNLQELWLPAAIVAAAGFGASRAGVVGIAGAAALCVVGITVVVKTATDPQLQRNDYRAAAAAIGQSARALVVTPDSGAAPLAAYGAHVVPLPPGT